MKNIELITEFEIEDIGIQEEWVYDIEVQDNHNFFGNNILLHNSVYMQLGDDIPKKLWACKDSKTYNEKIDVLDDYCENTMIPEIQVYLDDVNNTLNALKPELMEEDREAIADSGIFIAKKKYIARICDNEGERFPEDSKYIKKMGVELVKSSTAVYSKEKLNEAVPILLDKDETHARDWLRSTRDIYLEKPIAELSKVSSVSKLEDEMWGQINPETNRRVSIPYNSKAAIATNNYISDKGLDTQFNLINPGDKIKITALRMPNPFGAPAIGFTDGRFIEKFRDYIDYDENYQKNFLKPLEIMTSALQWNVKKETEDLDDW